MFSPIISLVTISSLLSLASAFDRETRAEYKQTHGKVAKRFGSGNFTIGGSNSTVGGIQKRSTSYTGEATYFTPGLGACGEYSSSSDYMVALNEDQYGDLDSVSSWCFQEISITYGSKTHTATILDACPGCGDGGLDMSPTLFEYFADLSVGVFYMDWEISGGGSDDTTTTTTKKTTTTTTTTTHKATTTTTTTTTTTYYEPTTTTTTSYYESTTSSYSPTTTTTTTTSTTSLSSSSSSDSSSTTANSTSTSLSSSSTSLNSTITSTLSNNVTSTSTSTSSSASASATVIGDYLTGSLYLMNQVFMGFSGIAASAANQAIAG